MDISEAGQINLFAHVPRRQVAVTGAPGVEGRRLYAAAPHKSILTRTGGWRTPCPGAPMEDEMSRRLMMTACMSLAATIGAAAPALHAQPAPHSNSGQCFLSRDWSSWKASPDSRTIYLRVGVRDIFRLDLDQACTNLKSLDARLITKIRGSDWICSPLDLDLRVSDGLAPGFSEACIVKGLSKLTPDQVAALPKQLRP